MKCACTLENGKFTVVAVFWLFQTFLFSPLELRNAASGFCFVSISSSPGLTQFVMRTGLCVCMCVCGPTCAGSPCLPAVWGVWVEISCWPERPPCPQSPSSSTPGWLNGWGVSRPDPRFHPAAHKKTKETVKAKASARSTLTQQDTTHLSCKEYPLVTYICIYEPVPCGSMVRKWPHSYISIGCYSKGSQACFECKYRAVNKQNCRAHSVES